jgi:hypothetical protein
MPAHQFTIRFTNERGALASLLEALATAGVELRSIGSSRIGQQGAATLIPHDPELVRTVLQTQGYRYAEGEVLITSAVDAPGAIAAIVRQLSDAGINVHGLITLGWHQGKADLAISVDDVPAARRVLGT